MIILNTTFIIVDSILEPALQWIRSSYLESSRRLACVEPKPYLTKILGQHEPGVQSYALHIYFPDLVTAEKWNLGVAASLRTIMHQRWGEQMLAFHTYLEIC